MLAHRTLTELALSNANPPETGAYTIWDGSQKHFGARISRGAKSFILLIGSGRRQVIGHYPTLSIAQARAKAKQILAERTLGKYAPNLISWTRATEEFLEHRKETTRPKTHYEYKRTFPYFNFGTTPVSEVTTADIRKKLEKIKAASQREHCRVVATMFFNWAVKRGYCHANPCSSIEPAKQRGPSRTLSDEELKTIWQVCSNHDNDLHEHYRTIVKLLILLGQRRGETAALSVGFYSHNEQTITLPPTLTKNGEEHVFVVGQLTRNILQTLPNEGLFFPARGSDEIRQKPFNGWSKEKVRLNELTKVSKWTLHAIRRTFRTNLARIGIPTEIAERYINHISHRSEVEKIYDRWHYLPQLRDCAERYEAWLSTILC